jgi:hypothetical protein
VAAEQLSDYEGVLMLIFTLVMILKQFNYVFINLNIKNYVFDTFWLAMKACPGH